MEKRGGFPRRFNLTPRCVVWDLEVAVAELELAFEVGAPQIVGRRQGTAFRWTAAAGCPIVGHEADYRVGSILARRELVRPEDVGLAKFGRRRVPGLRREELATLAGISSDYYLRLEQGRDHHPSAQVIDALARALKLDEHATVHLNTLSHPAAAQRRLEKPEHAPTSIKQLIACWSNTPAFVQGRYMDILAANALALALSPVYSPGVNLVRATFLDPELRRFVGDWEVVAHTVVARLRALAGPDVEDPRLVALVDELSVRSDRFRRLWARHDIEPVAIPTRAFNHALVGLIELRADQLAIAGTERQLLIVYHAKAGSPSERALCLLAGMAAGNPRQHPSSSTT